ncbi:hypothetical protein K1719_006499 [Acacia pycnantha]|nr:hypothetical protein K1719_006499 [Acacia pycnantha]
MCAFAFILERKIWSKSELQHELNQAWKLQGTVSVRGRSKHRFLLHFQDDQDHEYMTRMGPWSINNSLLIVSEFQRDVILECDPLPKTQMWAYVWGLPMDYHTRSTAKLVGDIIGDFEEESSN